MAMKDGMRPTTKDLAKSAGVSLATVDRVLNGRPNVSQKASEKVRDAIERIGFTRNIAAANLAKKTNYRFRFVLPEAGDQYAEEIVKEIQAANNSLRSELVYLDTVRIAIEDPHLVANHLSALDSQNINGVAVMAPESPQVRDSVARLIEKNIKVVRLLSGHSRPSGADFVGVDNYAAGATAARIIGRFNCHKKGKVMVISETMRSQDSIERRLGFDDIINGDFPSIKPLPSLETNAGVERTRRIVKQTIDHNNDIVAVYVMSSEARVPVTCVSEFLDLRKITAVVHERTPFSVDALNAGDIDAVIAQNPGHAVRSAIRLLRARTDNREPVTSQESVRIEILLRDNL